MAIRGRRIFISGGSGFIGSHLVERLAATNEVTVFDSGRRNALRSLKIPRNWKLNIIQGDILDRRSLEAAMKGAEIVVHLAAITGVPSYYRYPVLTMRVNMLGTANVLETARVLRVARFVNFSSSEIYGPRALGARETDMAIQGPAGHLRWTYGVSKLAGEHLALAYHAEHGLATTSLRPFNIYGPRQLGEGAVAIFVSKALAGEDLPVQGSGSQIRAWCYITDMVEAILLAMEHPGAIGQCFNIGNPKTKITTLGLARKIKALSRSRSKIIFKPPPPEEVELRIPSIAKAKSVLGYTPKVGLNEGLRHTIQWFRTGR